MVAQIDEQHAAMVANTMAPAGKPHGLVDIAVAERAAGMGPVTMHGMFQKQMSEDRIGAPKARPKSGRVYPRLSRRGNQWRAPVLRPKCEHFGARTARTVCLFRRRAYLWVMTVHFPFQNTYAALPANFFARVAPTPVAAPRLIKLNRPLAVHLGLDPDRLDSPEGAEILAGKRLPDGADPIAMAYAGHQFGHFVPQLGDGRAILLGEVIDADGVRRDIQLKGSGPTPFSRRGDGRAALGPVLREYIVSEAMAALGIPTTRSLAAVITGERVMRETMLPGAVLTRVAASHIRVGTFQFFAARGDTDGVRRLADHVIARHYPDVGNGRAPLSRAARRRRRPAGRAGRALAAGRLHPWRHEHRQHARSPARPSITAPAPSWTNTIRRSVFSSIDEQGRYAYANQPRIALWNLTRLAECLLPLFSDDKDKAIEQAQSILGEFAEKFTAAYQAGLRKQDRPVHRARRRRGAGAGPARRDGEEPGRLHPHLPPPERCRARCRRRRASGLSSPIPPPSTNGPCAGASASPTSRNPPAERQAAMRAVNPAFIPRNHRVEAVIAAAVNNDDYAPFEELLTVLSKPYEDQPAFAAYAEPPLPEQRVLQTFCGT